MCFNLFNLEKKSYLADLKGLRVLQLKHELYVFAPEDNQINTVHVN